MNRHIDVIATTISGSVHDWGKVERIAPLFRARGEEDIELHVVDSHAAAREAARNCVRAGSTVIIAAGGSGTFNSVLEGCLDADPNPERVQLGFLRKGSADLIGKTLGMPDEIEAAVQVFVDAIRHKRTIPCDLLEARSEEADRPPRHFVGYGGAEIFGLVPRFTENRFIKYYKGILSQLFGDLGPFRVGIALATVTRSFSFPRRDWTVTVDGEPVVAGRLQALIITNGDLGPDMPFAKGEPLGSGEFHVFLVRDLGLWRLAGQLRRTWSGAVLEDPGQWGFQAVRAKDELTLRVADGGVFPLNVDGSTLLCHGAATVRRCGRIHLFRRGDPDL